MKIPLPTLNFLLRNVEKPHLRRATDVVRLRRRFGCQARLLFSNPAGATYRKDRLPGGDGDIDALWATGRGAKRDGVLLYLHGGAYVMGSPDTHRAMLARLSEMTGFPALLPDYRMAPENPFPAGLEDVFAAYEALISTGTAPGRIILGGDSAGGGLMLALLHRICARDLPRPDAVFAFSPWVDLTLRGGTLKSNAAADPLLPVVRTVTSRDMYLNGADPADPAASPLFGEFSGAPPVLIQVGDCEILLDDSRRMAVTLTDQGVDVRLKIHPLVPHVWQIFQGRLAEADAALRDVADFLDEVLDPATGVPSAR